MLNPVNWTSCWPNINIWLMIRCSAIGKVYQADLYVSNANSLKFHVISLA